MELYHDNIIGGLMAYGYLNEMFCKRVRKRGISLSS